ncbi:MAG: regulatory protein RecX [Spirochaetes bacterium]|nr:MAG: regulatory protein RecX [Spirochaetota bacterium]
MIEVISIRTKGESIYAEFSTGEKLLVPPDFVKIYGLASGKSIDPSSFEKLKEGAERHRCRRKALDRLALRARSVREMETYLQGKGFPREMVTGVTASLKDAGYLDDFECAMQYIRARKSRKAMGKNLLAAELARKGIDRGTATKALAESGADTSDPEMVYACARSRLARLAGKRNRLGKLAYFLNRRGFDAREVRAAIDRLRREGLISDESEEEIHDEGQ